jgi:hypothetical protein
MPCEIGVNHREAYFTGVAPADGTGVQFWRTYFTGVIRGKKAGQNQTSEQVKYAKR